MAVITEARDFRIFCADLKIDARLRDQVEKQMRILERTINLDYWDAMSAGQTHLLSCGSYARGTCLDAQRIDLLAILPGTVYHRCQSAGSAADDLQRILRQRYATAVCEPDGRTVTLTPAKSLRFHILPTLITTGGNYICPAADGRDSFTPLRWEQVYGLRDNQRFDERDRACKGNLTALCRMIRVWNEEMDAGMSGEMIDTLAYHFMETYDERCCLQVCYDRLCLDFFSYLIGQAGRRYWRSIGGKRRIYNRADFGYAARRAHELTEQAIVAYRWEQPARWYRCWQMIFGDRFPVRL
ncbi:MAG: hypothetical protein IJ493_03265 [Clostridia bacterium]|nr:hypothetical protein [Clostridia bacterium]